MGQYPEHLIEVINVDLQENIYPDYATIDDLQSKKGKTTTTTFSDNPLKSEPII